MSELNDNSRLTCGAYRCEAQIAPGLEFCGVHFALLPSTIKRDLRHSNGLPMTRHAVVALARAALEARPSGTSSR